jgi:hypothetical protein
VWPHFNVTRIDGPLDVKIGVTSQPALLRGWDKRNVPRLQIEQPLQTESNLTIIRILFVKHGSLPPECPGKWHQGNVWGIKELPPREPPDWEEMNDEAKEGYCQTWKKMKPSHITVYIKGRIADLQPHPIPRGHYDGTLTETDRWAMFTFQAVSLQVAKPQAPERSILLAGDPGFEDTCKALNSGIITP